MATVQVNPAGENTYASTVAGSSANVRAMCDAARALIAAVMPGVTEVAWPKQGTIGYGVGPKKMSEHFCYIGIHDKHVNLGFFYGADLPDPDGLLAGTGKAMRHIRLESPEDLERAGVRTLVEHASRHLPKLDPGRSG